MARTETNEPGRRINASIGLARPSDPSMYGYISEHHGYGRDEVDSGDYARGPRGDHARAWNERRHVHETSSPMIIESKSITAFAQGDRSGLWTCAVAAAVFRFEVPPG
jgi:arginine decarboxylase